MGLAKARLHSAQLEAAALPAPARPSPFSVASAGSPSGALGLPSAKPVRFAPQVVPAEGYTPLGVGFTEVACPDGIVDEIVDEAANSIAHPSLDTSELLDVPTAPPSGAVQDAIIKAAIVVVGIGLIWWSADRLTLGRFSLHGMSEWGWGWRWLVMMPGVVFGAILAGSYVYRTWLWLRYRPIDGLALSDEELPSITVVIPAYNEGPMVRKTIQSALQSNYPREKLRVIAVDDGSKDETFAYMVQATAIDPTRVRAVTLGENRGKRHALYEGFRQAETDLVVTLDSDSMLPPNAIRNLAAPFARDADVGATAGCIKVYNRYQNLLTRMLGVRYLLGFEFTRAYQSVLNSVLCCPGAFAAYRRTVIAPHLDAWLQQTFMGNRCTNGDDHSLTNYVLRSEKAVLYQGNAECFTVVPHTYKRLSKMYTRWARSNIRESWIWMHFATSRARARREWLALTDGLIHFALIPARLYLLLFTGAIVWTNADLLMRSLAMATIFSVLYAVYFLRSEKSTESIYGVLYAWFALLTLQWIYPWAALTVRQNRWMTRG